MLPLFDMMLKSQNGAAMDMLSRQFNLAQEQSAKAMAALMPAFSAAFKRSSANPYDFKSLMDAAASGNYARYFEDFGKAFTPQGMAAGNTILERIFGSTELTSAIAAEAAKMSGIGQDVMRQIMPAVAGALTGGIFKQMTGQGPDMRNPLAGTPLEGAMQQWLESIGLARKPEPPMTPFDNPFTQAMQAMMGMTPPQAEKPAPAADPFSLDAYARAMQDMMASGLAATRAMTGTAAPAPEPEPAPLPGPAEAYAQAMNSLFDSGIEAQKGYQKTMEQLFDTYFRPKA